MKPGLRSRLIAYFEANPLDTLTSDDIAIKFGVPKRSVQTMLSTLKAEGVLQRNTVWSHKPVAPATFRRQA
jgi:DNA-binding IclR family transcriptional regulator